MPGLKLLLFVIGVSLVEGLDPHENFFEGTCSQFNIPRIKGRREFVDSLTYISGGSKDILYRLASGAPNYPEIREDEFYYNGCFRRNSSTTILDKPSALFGFGRVLATYWISTPPGSYMIAKPTDPEAKWYSEVFLTLTDHKTFAVLINCINTTGQRSWTLLTSTGNIDKRIERKVIEHVEALGFDKRNFIFMKQDSCGKPNHFDAHWA